MKNLNFFLSRSLRWLGFEAIAYQLLLLGHQLLLFKVSDYGTYGLIGATFSLVYLIVTLADGGLEPSISPFFATLTQNREAFGKFIFNQLVPNSLIVGTLFIAAALLRPLLPMTLLISINTPLLCALAALALTETIKKTLRTMLHLAFLNRSAAFIEVGTIVSYIASVWILYALGIPIGLPLIFVPMLATSAISTGAMAIILYHFYSKLPNSTAPINIKRRVLKSRFFNYFNQLSHTLFSSNFLVPFFALQFGLAHAGVFKLVSHIAYALTGILRKIFGLSSDAMLAKTKTMNLADRKEVFLRLTQRLHHALYAIIIFFAINHAKILTGPSAHQTEATLIYLFLIICLSENLFIAYEKLYITQERADRLLIFNLLTMLFTYLVVHYAPYLSLLGVLVAIILVRVCMFMLLSIVAFYTWRIRPSWKLQPHYVAAALCTALSFFVLFR